MFSTNDLKVSDPDKFSFDGTPFSSNNLPAKKECIFHKAFGTCQLRCNPLDWCSSSL